VPTQIVFWDTPLTIGAGLAGIIGFSPISFMQAPPWLAICCIRPALCLGFTSLLRGDRFQGSFCQYLPESCRTYFAR
jgi:hypothetical protein